MTTAKRLGALVAAALALLSGPAAAERWTFQHVTLIDGTGAPPRPDMSVVVDGGRFVAILPSGRAGPPQGRVIDGRGKFLIPGLIDIHIHLAGSVAGAVPGGGATVDRNAALQALASYLYAGVTTVLDVGNDPANILPLRADERAGRILAPRIFATGNLVTYPGSHGAGMAVTIEHWPEGRAALQAQLDSQHPDVQKITYDEEGWGARPLIPILPKDLLQHIVEYYNDHGVRTTVHISNEARAREAIFSGVDSLAHTPAQGPVTDAFVKLLAAKRIPVASTVTIGDNYGRLHDHPDYLDQPLYVATMSPAQRAELKRIAAAGGETALRGSPDLYRRAWRQYWQTQTPILQDNLRRIDAAGGLVALGTDATSGAATHRELELLAEAGIPNLHILRIATLNGARLLGREDEMGSIAEGKLADAVLLNADPAADIGNAKAIALVMKAGSIVDESRLPLAGGPQRRRFDDGQ
ncbi:MAG: amidohydrolase family protein [Alphaproteobacteria bacterium]|nr:amidohydrolase family protein [Alphaproteobacteria bacterium]